MVASVVFHFTQYQVIPIVDNLRSGFGSSCVSSSSKLFPFSAVTSDVKSVSAILRYLLKDFQGSNNLI